MTALYADIAAARAFAQWLANRMPWPEGSFGEASAAGIVRLEGVRIKPHSPPPPSPSPPPPSPAPPPPPRPSPPPNSPFPPPPPSPSPPPPHPSPPPPHLRAPHRRLQPHRCPRPRRHHPNRSPACCPLLAAWSALPMAPAGRSFCPIRCALICCRRCKLSLGAPAVVSGGRGCCGNAADVATPARPADRCTSLPLCCLVFLSAKRTPIPSYRFVAPPRATRWQHAHPWEPTARSTPPVGATLRLKPWGKWTGHAPSGGLSTTAHTCHGLACPLACATGINRCTRPSHIANPFPVLRCRVWAETGCYDRRIHFT